MDRGGDSEKHSNANQNASNGGANTLEDSLDEAFQAACTIAPRSARNKRFTTVSRDTSSKLEKTIVRLPANGDHLTPKTFYSMHLKTYDWSTGTFLMVDTGAQFSILPASEADKRPENAELFELGLNNTHVVTFGYRHVKLDFGLPWVFPWNFMVCEIDRAILGIDFIVKYDFLIDCPNAMLIHKYTNSCVHCYVEAVTPIVLKQNENLKDESKPPDTAAAPMLPVCKYTDSMPMQYTLPGYAINYNGYFPPVVESRQMYPLTHSYIYPYVMPFNEFPQIYRF